MNKNMIRFKSACGSAIRMRPYLICLILVSSNLLLSTTTIICDPQPEEQHQQDATTTPTSAPNDDKQSITTTSTNRPEAEFANDGATSLSQQTSNPSSNKQLLTWINETSTQAATTSSSPPATAVSQENEDSKTGTDEPSRNLSSLTNRVAGEAAAPSANSLIVGFFANASTLSMEEIDQQHQNTGSSSTTTPTPTTTSRLRLINELESVSPPSDSELMDPLLGSSTVASTAVAAASTTTTATSLAHRQGRSPNGPNPQAAYSAPLVSRLSAYSPASMLAQGSRLATNSLNEQQLLISNQRNEQQATSKIQQQAKPVADPIIVCYLGSWSVYRPALSKFTPENINPFLCTHVIYAFAGLSSKFELKPFDSYNDITQGGYRKFISLKDHNKQLKTLIAVGGWNEGSSRWVAILSFIHERDYVFIWVFIYVSIFYFFASHLMAFQAPLIFELKYQWCVQLKPDQPPRRTNHQFLSFPGDHTNKYTQTRPLTGPDEMMIRWAD